MGRKVFTDAEKDRLVEFVLKARQDTDKKGQKLTVPEACGLARKTLEPFKSMKDYTVESLQSLYTYWWGVREGKPYMKKKRRAEAEVSPPSAPSKAGALEILERAVDQERRAGLSTETKERVMRILEKLLDA